MGKTIPKLFARVPSAFLARIGGTWESAVEKFTPEKHRIGFSFQALKPLRDLAEQIEVFIEGCQTPGASSQSLRTSPPRRSTSPSARGMFSLVGYKLKIAGTDKDCGVYFVSAGNPAQRVAVSGHLAENSPGKIIGIIPPLSPGQWKIEKVSQFNGFSSSVLKSPRTVASAATFTVA